MERYKALEASVESKFSRKQLAVSPETAGEPRLSGTYYKEL